MKRKLQTIYEYFSDYTEKEIDAVVNSLSDDEKLIIRSRYGNDLHNPVTQEDWDKEKSRKYYGYVVPKIRRLLFNNHINIIEESPEIDVEHDTIELDHAPEIEWLNSSIELLQLLKTKNNREICEILNISSNQLYDELLKLKNKGILYTRKYYSDGSIRYKNVSTIKNLKNYKMENDERYKTIITEPYKNSMSFLLISDLHFGNELERIDLIDRAYNYCIKNGINIILCGGDFIDGSFTKGTQKISNLYEQVEYFIKNYPQDKSILTFGVGGDHDISIFNNASLDIIEMCNNFRHDIIIGGYNNAGINLKNDRIHLYHFIRSGEMKQTTAPIVLHGHFHKYTTELKNDTLNISIPTLSDILQPMPTALQLDVYFSKGYITSSVVKHLYFGEQDIILGESTFNLSKERNIDNNEIKNVEDYEQDLGNKVLSKTNRQLSQIEKWNKKYGL